MFPPPLRPIVVGIESLWENLSTWVDHLLQPIVQNLPDFLRDTKHVVTLLDGYHWEEYIAWLTCYVVALYALIPHEMALHKVLERIQKNILYSQEVKEFMIMAIAYLLKHNYFLFDHHFYLQTMI